MTLPRFAAAALAVVLNTVLNLWLIQIDAQDQWWIAVIVAAGVLTLAVMAWACGLVKIRP